MRYLYYITGYKEYSCEYVYVKHLRLFDVHLFVVVNFLLVYTMSVVLLDYKNI